MIEVKPKMGVNYWLQFKTTNVKDAYDGSLRILQALLPINTSFFVISTHILEVAEELAGQKQIAFRYLKTHTQGKGFRFDYRLQEGVSNDRIGLWILEKEGVFDLFKTGEKSRPH